MNGNDGSKKMLIEVEAHLRGKALKIYWYLLNKGSAMGVREIQKSLGFSSPSVAHHHLEKLMELKIVEKDQYGRYLIAQRVDVGVLQAFTKIGRLVLPRFIFYAIFFTSLLAFYIFQNYPSLDLHALSFGLAGVVVSWYETTKVWRRRPV